jgi:hypothetical protein
MKNVNPVTKRVVGGFSFADSMIRTSADTEKYVNYVLTLVSKKVIKEDVVLDSISDVFGVSIVVDDKRLFSLSNDDVEKFRKYEVLAFDKFIINILKTSNYDIDNTSDYYKRVEEVIL